MPSNASADMATVIGDALPYLRRYARALTGNQDTGDRFAAATLETLLVDSAPVRDAASAREGLFRAFHLIWQSAGGPVGEADSPLAARAQAHMARLTPRSREALLLHSIEGFGVDEIGRILDSGSGEAQELIEIARREMEGAVAGKVMIIEDEAIIAMDIRTIVEEMGHSITGIARTRREAVALAGRRTPDLILADIQLADNSSGVDAVNDILAEFPELPVVFITAFPERLLTGKCSEPAFLITKPYDEDQVRSAVSQAMFFASTETLLV